MSYLKIDKLKNYLREYTGLGYLNGNQSELICRCPFPNCEKDECKKYKYGRLYIDTRTPVFHCFRCQQSGTIFKLLKFLKLNTKEYCDLKHKVFENIGKRREIFIYDDMDVNIFDKLKISKPNTQRYNQKLTYLKGRLGFEEDVERIPHIIFNIREFINENNIQLSERDKQFIEIYDDRYIGFLSNKGTVITLRKTHGQGEDYHRLQITSPGHFKDFYGLWTGNIKYGQTNKIILCEGIFDLLLSIKSPELNDLRKDSCFFAAALGSYYSKLISSVCDYVKLPCVDVVVLSDKDKKPDDKIFKSLRKSPMIRNLEIYWNKFGHDWGEKPILPVKTVFQQINNQSFFKKRKKQIRGYR